MSDIPGILSRRLDPAWHEAAAKLVQGAAGTPPPEGGEGGPKKDGGAKSGPGAGDAEL